jgi:hypothetical protein
MSTDWQKEAIDKIMSNFKFERVHRAMVALAWKWVTTKGNMAIPNEQEIRECALDLLNRSCADKGGWSTGGFNVSIDNERKELSLDFSLESQSWCSSDYD